MTLKYTLEQVRDREVAALGTLGVPNAWWPSTYDRPWDWNNDCIKFQLFSMGVATRRQQDNHFISIAGFRGWAGWKEVTVADLRPGDIAAEVWEGGDEPDHVEFVYSIDHAGGKITTLSANTSPTPGVPMTEKNRGVYKKTRNLSTHFLFGIRPPYLDATATVTPSRRAQVRLTATWLNKTLPDTYQGQTIHRSAAGDIGKTAGDGLPGPLYWLEVQTWGRLNDEYGPRFQVDGIPGARTRQVEAVIYGKAKAAHKAT